MSYLYLFKVVAKIKKKYFCTKIKDHIDSKLFVLFKHKYISLQSSRNKKKKKQQKPQLKSTNNIS